MKLTEQLCPKEQIKIEFDNTYNHNDWIAEAQLTRHVLSFKRVYSFLATLRRHRPM